MRDDPRPEFKPGDSALYVMNTDPLRLVPCTVMRAKRLYTIRPYFEDGRPMRTRNVAWYSLRRPDTTTPPPHD